MSQQGSLTRDSESEGRPGHGLRPDPPRAARRTATTCWSRVTLVRASASHAGTGGMGAPGRPATVRKSMPFGRPQLRHRVVAQFPQDAGEPNPAV